MPRLRLVKRMLIGDNPEFVKINPTGDRLFATFEPSSEGGPPGAAKAERNGDDENGPPAQIASFHIGDWGAGPVSIAGQETEGSEFSRDAKLMLVANESQETMPDLRRAGTTFSRCDSRQISPALLGQEVLSYSMSVARLSKPGLR